jgi:hypothetical protein
MPDDRKAPLRSVPRPRGPTTRGGCGLGRLRQLGLSTVLSDATPLAYAKEPKASCDGAGDGAVVHIDKREVDLGRALVWTSILFRPLTSRAPPCIGL